MQSSSLSPKRFLALFAAFFALYALTAQRGVGYGDSAEFQNWILNSSAFVCGQSFSNAHPLYVAFARFVAPTPLAVTLVSSLFGALAVSALYLCTRRVTLSVLFGLSQMLWWLSCVAEVQTMSLAFTAFATFLLVRYFETHRPPYLCAAAFVCGLHLGVHNFALLAGPAAIVIAVTELKARHYGTVIASLVCGLLGAAYWLYAIAQRGLRDVLVGNYAAKVSGFWPSNANETLFNFALAALSFFVPAMLFYWKCKADGGLSKTRWDSGARLVLAVLFATHLIFFVRYFVPDQSQFLLPTLFFAYVLLGDAPLEANRFAALAAMQIILPLFAYQVAVQLPVPADRASRHPGRNEARYFILPWRIPQ